jgi:hypothetical protein
MYSAIQAMSDTTATTIIVLTSTIRVKIRIRIKIRVKIRVSIKVRVKDKGYISEMRHNSNNYYCFDIGGYSD